MPTYVRIRNPIIFPSNPSRRLIPEPGTQIASPLLPRPGRYREPALDVWYSGTPGSDSSRQTLTARSLTNNTDFEARIGDEFYTDQRIALALRRSRSASAIWLRSEDSSS